jgi:hypothetical protein
LTVSANHKAPTGTSTLTITATSGGLTHNQQVTLTLR